MATEKKWVSGQTWETAFGDPFAFVPLFIDGPVEPGLLFDLLLDGPVLGLDSTHLVTPSTTTTSLPP